MKQFLVDPPELKTNQETRLIEPRVSEKTVLPFEEINTFWEEIFLKSEITDVLYGDPKG